MPKCDICGKEVKFIYNKKDNVKILVESKSVYFVPPNGYDREETFINTAGQEVKGCRTHDDGQTGHRRHVC